MKNNSHIIIRTIILLCLLPLYANVSLAQFDSVSSSFDDDLSSSTDIFTNFDDDLGTREEQEDERFYRYGRFVSASFGFGITSFTGNRGKAYHDKNPTIAFGLIYFSDFQNAFNIGIEYSRHVMYLDNPTLGSGLESYGAIDITYLRPYFAYRYYVDTSDLSSLLTYANPYFIGRIEYWYQNRKFKEYNGNTDTAGSIGGALGLGVEIPIDLKKNYISLQFLVHQVTLPDTDTEEYEVSNSCTDADCYGYSDMKGMGYSLVTSYLFSW